jgi:hypothetical protein
VLLQISSLPDSDWSTTDPGERWNNGVWVAGWVPPITNAVLLCPPMLQIFRTGQIGKVVLTIQGLGLMGCGVAAAAIGMKENPPIATGWDIAPAMFEPMNNALQVLRLPVDTGRDILAALRHEGLHRPLPMLRPA